VPRASEKVMQNRLNRALKIFRQNATPDPEFPDWLVFFPEGGLTTFLAKQLLISTGQARTVLGRLEAEELAHVTQEEGGTAVWVRPESGQAQNEIVPEEELRVPTEPPPAAYTVVEALAEAVELQRQIDQLVARRTTILNAVAAMPRTVELGAFSGS
jgi:hypothetical protein